MRPRTIRTAFYAVALLWAAFAAEPLAAHADAAAPAIDSLTPTSISAGTGGVTVAIAGSGFDSSSQVKFNGDVLTPASVAPTQITVAIPPADIANGGYIAVTVTGAAGESGFKLFTVENQAPQILGVSPNTAFAGGNQLTMTLVGTGFNVETQVRFGVDTLTPDTVTPTQLTVTVPAGEIVTAGTVSVSAINPDPVTGTSNTQTFTIVTPYPIISSLSPSTIPAGATGATVTVTGLNFTNASTVQWNGAALNTTFVSATSLTAMIPAADFAAMTTASVTVADTAYGVSASVPFVVTAAIPTAATLNPSSASSGDPNFTLTVNGFDFQAGSVIKWGNTALTTAFVSPNQLTATIPTGYVWTPATIPVTVSTAMNGKTSITAPLTFTVNVGAPTIATLSPASQIAGGAAFTLTVTGSKCLSGATINWNGTPLPTTVVSSSMLTAQVTPDLIATAGTASITLSNTGSNPSGALTFTIAPRPGPQITTLSPGSVEAGTPDTLLTVTGANFTNNCVVQWAGTPLATTFVSATSLTATIPAANLSAITAADITVLDSAFGLSPAVSFKVTATTPTAASLSPSSANSGDPDFVLTVNGANFQAGSIINWGNNPLATIFVSPSQLTAAVVSGLIWTTASIPVTVTTPMIGRTATTTPLNFTVNAGTPSIAGLSPDSQLAGGPAFTLIVTGAKCLMSATINWNGTPLPTTVVSSSMLTAQVTPDLIATAGTASITLSNAGSAPSSPLTFTIVPRIPPTIVSLSPNSVAAQSPDTRLTVTGTGFTPASTVCWYGSALATTFISGTTLIAIIPAGNLIGVGPVDITVVDTDMGVSTPVTFTVTAPPPTAISLSPSSANSGDPDFTLTVSGSDFQADSVINWGNNALATTFVSPTQLTATVPANLIWTTGVIPVTVCTPMLGGYTATTTPLTFTVNAGTPTIGALSPASQLVNGPAFTLTVTGSKCLSGATINWNGTPLPTTVVSSSMLTAQVTPDLIATAGTASITLSNAGSAPSSPLTFTIAPRIAPTIVSLSPSSVAAQSSDTRLTVTGTGFTRASKVCWNGAILTTGFASATSLVATIPASNLTSVGTAGVTVSDPDMGVSNSVTFTVTSPPPTATSLSPSSANSGDPDFTLTVSGSDFQAGSVINWGNNALATTFVSPTQLTATVPANLIWTTGAIPVTVCTPMGGKTATTVPLTFTINASTPTIKALSPASQLVGSSAFTLTVTSSKCLKGATINWNGTPLATTIVSSSTLTAQITPDLIANVGTASITLSNIGSAPSSPLTFTIAPRIAPTIVSLSPSSVAAQSSDTRLTVTGTGFTRASKVCWNGAILTTGFASATSLVATIPASNLASAGTAGVTVSDPDMGVSNSVTFTVTSPPPTATSLSPSSANSGDPDFTLTVSGSDFQASSKIMWGNIPLNTTMVSSSKLTATVAANLIWKPTALPVTVSTVMGGKTVTTAPLNFTVNPSTPTISALSPASKIAGSSAFTLTVTGTRYLAGATISWNGTGLSTTLLSSNAVMAQVSADQIATAGTAAVTVSNAGSAPSNPLTFQIIPKIAPTIVSLSPSSVAAQSKDTRLAVTGTGFTRASKVCWNGNVLTTGFASATSLVATIPASLLTTAGPASVTVSDSDYGVSKPATFTVTAPPPTAISLSPASAFSGDPSFTLTVNGADFQSSSVILWGATPLNTTVVSSSKLTATVTASLIWAPSTFPITVSTTMGGKIVTTAPLTFTVNPGAPAIAALSPASMTAGGTAFTLTVTGSKCLKGATINWNGTALATTIVSSSMLTAQISADKIAAVGAVVITLSNIGSASSSPLTFQITAPPTPKIGALTPNTVAANSSSGGIANIGGPGTDGGKGLQIAIRGSNFTSASVAQWNGMALTTVFVSAGSLKATLPASSLNVVQTANITVADPKGGVSAPATFTVTAPLSTASSLSPASASSGDPDFTLTVNGADFQASSRIMWGNTALATTFVSTARLTARVPANYIWTVATIPVTVSTSIGGKSVTTAPLTFIVNAAAPTISALSPASQTAGGTAFTLTVTGAKCLKGATINWNGTALPTTILSSSTLTAQVSAGSIASAGTASVTLSNIGSRPSPGLPFTITAAALTSVKK